MRQLEVRAERWPLAQAFVISRGAKTEAHVVVAEITEGAHRGRGEAVPYARYGETVEAVLADMTTLRPRIAAGLDRVVLQALLPAGAARNALDCALWDLAAQRGGRRARELAGRARPDPVQTSFSLCLGLAAAIAALRR